MIEQSKIRIETIYITTVYTLKISGVQRTLDQIVKSKPVSGDFSERDPPDTISNSAVKPFSADDSVGVPM